MGGWGTLLTIPVARRRLDAGRVFDRELWSEPLDLSTEHHKIANSHQSTDLWSYIKRR